jgi:hypothetical protein
MPTMVLYFLFWLVLLAVMDCSMPIQIRLVAGGVFSPMGEDPAVFYRRYRSHLMTRVFAAVPLAALGGVAPLLPIVQPIQIAAVIVAVVSYGSLIIYHMVLARTR